MDVHAIVVNYSSSSYLEPCIASLLEAGLSSCIVVDNYSDRHELDAARAIANRHAPAVKFISSPTNLGFGAGVNLGFASLGIPEEDLVWIVNPDTLVSKQALHSLRSRFENNEADIVSPLILTGDQSNARVWFGGGTLNTKQGKSEHQHYGEPTDGLSGLHASDFITGAAPLMKSATFASLHGFREDLFLYWEDTDLSARAFAKGLRLAVDLDATIWHAEGGSGDRSGKSAHYYYYMQRNRLVVMGQWIPKSRLVLTSGAAETAKLLFRPLKEKQQKGKKFLASLNGLIAGLQGRMNRY